MYSKHTIPLSITFVVAYKRTPALSLQFYLGVCTLNCVSINVNLSSNKQT